MPRFELSRRSGSSWRPPWAASLALHVLVIVLGITVMWQAPLHRRRAEPEVTQWLVIPPVGGTRSSRPQAVTTSRRVGLVAPQAESPPLNVPLHVPDHLSPASKSEGPVVLGPQVGDGRVWVSPRPALPEAVAERLYGDTTWATRDSIATGRLHAMLDSLNQMIDREQREHRRPTWSTEVAGIPFGIDSQFINIAGIKIPTMALAFLGNLLPPGNYDAALREREFEGMRQDLLRAAARAETFRDFQRYVKELRARKQAERDADRARQTPPDTTHVIP